MNSRKDHYELVIVGAGMVGATLACLLGQQGRKVAVIESHLPEPFAADAPPGLRVSAISRASQRAFMDVGAWERMLAMRVSPYEAMHVWEGEPETDTAQETAALPFALPAAGEIRFEAADLGEPDLGHIIENHVVQQALLEVMQTEAAITLLHPESLAAFTVSNEQVQVSLASGRQLTADLLVGADGAYSKVRTLAGIPVSCNDYGQRGLVATIEPEQPHQATAWQRFLPSGPLALLPLANGHCSIVWTLPADKADYYLAMDEPAFNQALSKASAYRLGQLAVRSPRAAFPLVGRHAGQYVLPGVALVGDAAHTIHPLAGQGVNLGIKDAVELASVLAASKRPAGSYLLLRRYERARKADNLLTQKAMEGFKVLFGHSSALVRLGRNTGLNLVDRLGPVKHEIMRAAMGV